ncbi:lyase family protein [Halomonas dongshanensis]|uniref:argininosuccinate lyase n=1 Tax=Halomonas dongshanensis TaxID=2890835 RepID=A0ABT2EGP7_9GAMM|nr:lyase family protein [Halomonas dongshanensis]MCS2610674.1 ATP-grasp domain-containing protein [Halomonas dongshanensis]
MAIIYIESNTTGFGEALLSASLPYDDVYFLIRNPSKYAFLNKLNPRIQIKICDTSSIDAIAETITDIDDIRYVTSTSDGFIQVSSEISELLNLNGNSPSSVNLCRDKFSLQNVLRDYGVNYPMTREIRQPDDLRDIDYPVIVKPRQGTGSSGVQFIDSQDHLPQLIGGSWILQQFTPGAEFSVETFTDDRGHHVLAVTRKFVTKPPHFLEIAHVLPLDLDEANHQKVAETAIQALDAVGYKFGPAHTELKTHADSVTVIEINARLAGGMIPRLMEHAYGWSLVDLYIRSYLSGRCQFKITEPYLTASVSFIVPEIGRSYLGIEFPAECFESGEFYTTGRNEGNFDFSDRAGYVIATGTHGLAALRSSVRSKKYSRVLYVDTNESQVDANDIHDIVNKSSGHPRFDKLTSNLLTIEKAHLLMLRYQGVINSDQFRDLKEAVVALEYNPDLLEEHHSGRGDYFDYEHYMIDHCGRNTGGLIQAARSRNDINATHLLLSVKAVISAIVKRAITLVGTLTCRAGETLEVPLPIYSQYQTAMPGTAGHYMTAQGEILLDSLDPLIALRDELKISPLGACAGAGTSFNTDSHLTASLLGFKVGPTNSLSAITDKNPALRCSSLMTILSGDINRIASDLQLWSMREIAFITLPNGMYGGSSNMPQKRNPYLLEWLRLHHDLNVGYLAGAFSSLTHIPTGNSYQASRTAIETVTEIADKLLDMLDVLTYAIKGLSIDISKTVRAVKHGNACATLVAENLVQQGKSSFRDAHTAVGSALFSGGGHKDFLATGAANLLSEFESDANGAQAYKRLTGGGGPATDNTQVAITSLNERLRAVTRHQLVLRERELSNKLDLDNRFRRTN